MSQETDTQVIRVSQDLKSDSGSQGFENYGQRVARVQTEASGQNYSGQILNRNRLVSHDAMSLPGTEYTVDDLEIKRAGIDYDLSSVGGESQYAKRNLGVLVKGGGQAQTGAEEGYFHYNDEDENESSNNYNYYKDKNGVEGTGSNADDDNDSHRNVSSFKKKRAPNLRQSDVIKNFDDDDNDSMRSSERAYNRGGGKVIAQY